MTDKFITPCELPTEYEREILTILMEECAEVIQRASKAIRFGLDEIQPEQCYANHERLAFEVGDLLAVIDLCQEAPVFSAYQAIHQKSAKRDKLSKYMQTSPDVPNDGGSNE